MNALLHAIGALFGNRFSLGLMLLSLGSFSCGEARVLVVDMPPYAYYEGANLKGVAYDLVHEMARRAGYSGKVELMPLARIVETIRHNPNVIATMGRAQVQDKDYSWLAKMIDEPILLLTERNSPVDISTVEAARHLRIGVQKAGPTEQLALSNGFTKVESVPRPEQNAQKLARNRIDAWLAPWWVAANAQARAELTVDRLRRGTTLGYVNGYLAASSQLDPVEADKWKSAFASMKKDGSYARIMRSYHFDPVP